MKYIKFLFTSISATASSLLGLFVGFGLMTYLNLFTYKLFFDAITLFFIIAVFMFGGLKFTAKVIR